MVPEYCFATLTLKDVVQYFQYFAHFNHSIQYTLGFEKKGTISSSQIKQSSNFQLRASFLCDGKEETRPLLRGVPI